MTNTTSTAAKDLGNILSEFEETKAKLTVAEVRITAMEKKISELEELSQTDPVTGLMNRRGFEKFFEREQARVRRYNALGSVLLLFDLDKFKDINDTHGHQAGDACLKKVGEFLQGRLRTLDGAARIGGDEFAVLLAHTDPEKAAACISEIKAILGNMHTQWHDTELKFSASVGMEYISGEGTYEDACKAADKSLYTNKRARR